MPVLGDEIAEYKHAYQVLGVPHYATARAIKTAYYKLVKRWHPDLYTASTPEHAEATQMSMLINQAHSAIAHAPLRYRSSPSAVNGTSHKPYSPVTATMRIKIEPLKPHRIDRLEFWVRFVCGALFGLFSGVFWALSEMSTAEIPMIAGLGILALTAGFGLAAARYGDKFWYSVLQFYG
jgi:hypothetical protein